MCEHSLSDLDITQVMLLSIATGFCLLHVQFVDNSNLGSILNLMKKKLQTSRKNILRVSEQLFLNQDEDAIIQIFIRWI